ncbi:MAG: hypothetical protein AAF490_20940 [Chloroflexota bacterium]
MKSVVWMLLLFALTGCQNASPQPLPTVEGEAGVLSEAGDPVLDATVETAVAWLSEQPSC